MTPPTDQWAKLFDRDSPQITIDQAVDRVVENAMRDLLRRVNADASLDFEERSAILLRAFPLIYQHTRAMLQRAWEDLQIAGQVH